MPSTEHKRIKLGMLAALIASLGAGVLIGAMVTQGQAQTAPPTEHKGVGVTALGVLSEASIQRQIGLSGYVMQLREITVEPSGQIARHSHATRPGLAYTLSGSLTEGRPSGERVYLAGEKVAILEDEATEHWAWNRGSEPARIVVCDIVPPS